MSSLVPSAVPHKWGRNQEDASEGWPGRLVGQGSDQNRPADRVANQDGPVVQPIELPFERRLPGRILRIGLMGHSRIVDGVIRAEFSLEALHDFVVPFVMDVLAAALNKQHVVCHRGSPL